MKPQLMCLKVVVFILLTALPRAAFALCDQGTWTNVDPASGGITRIQITFACEGQVLCPIGGDCFKSATRWRVHLWGKCQPSDCDWGAVDANEVWLGPTKWIVSIFDQGFAKRYVYITAPTTSSNEVLLWMSTDFVDPARADYTQSGTFRR